MSLKGIFKISVVVILILSFLITAINGGFFGGNLDSETVATVRGEKIPASEFLREYQIQAYNIQNMFNFSLTEQQLKSFGLGRMVLNRIIQEKIIEEFLKKINFKVPNDAVIESIRSNTGFQTDNKFDKKKFDDFLKYIGITEELYVQKVGFEIARKIFFGLFFQISGDISKLAKRFYNLEYQMRTIGIATLPENTKINIKQPTQEELIEFYQKNKDKFRLPEYRSGEYLILSQDSIKPEFFNISSDQIKEKFNELELGKTFDVDYMIFTSIEDMQRVKRSINDNLSFYENDIKHLKNQIKPELADFLQDNLKLDSTEWQTAQYKDNFYLFRITNAKDASEDEKKDREKIVIELLKAQRIDDLLEKIEGELASSRTFEKIQKKYGLTLKSIAPVDQSGRTKDGKFISISEDILKELFDAKKEERSGFFKVGDEYITVLVTDIESSREQNFEEVQDLALSTMIKDLRYKALGEAATQKVVNGSFDNVINVYREEINKEKNPSQNLPEGFLDAVFELQKEQITQPFNLDGKISVAKLLDTKNPEESELLLSKVEESLKEEISLSLITELTDYYNKAFNVKINTKSIEGFL